MTALLTRFSGKCLQAGVTEKPLSGRGSPCFMITLALSIIETNPFTYLHFLQAIRLELVHKKGLDVLHQQDSIRTSTLGVRGCKSKQQQLIHLFKTFSYFQRLRHTEHNGV